MTCRFIFVRFLTSSIAKTFAGSEVATTKVSSWVPIRPFLRLGPPSIAIGQMELLLIKSLSIFSKASFSTSSGFMCRNSRPCSLARASKTSSVVTNPSFSSSVASSEVCFDDCSCRRCACCSGVSLPISSKTSAISCVCDSSVSSGK